MSETPLSVGLSRLLLAFTIELDNEFERRMGTALPDVRYRVTSLVMWSNFLRFVGDGIAVGELPAAPGLPKARVLSTLGGMERWRYVYVAPPPARKAPGTRRDGYGSARALKGEWMVRPTAAGVVAQEIWPSLLPEIEGRWSSRFGASEVGELRAACLELRDDALPEYLPIVVGATGMVSEILGDGSRASEPAPLSALLAQVLLAYTLAFEREAPLSLPLTEAVVRVLGADAVDVRELPAAAAVSPEAISIALTYLARKGYAEGKKAVRLTASGHAARDESQEMHSRVELMWNERHGTTSVARLRSAAERLLERPGRLALGLEPHPEGWRASGGYLAQTKAMLADPLTGLPRHPLVLHRGGWPDGS
jgi:hypothetical protein